MSLLDTNKKNSTGTLSAIKDITRNKIKTTGVSAFMELQLELVYPNPAQPRKAFNDIDELASSISEKGLIQPIAVVKDGSGKYMIVSGERRFRAIDSLGLRTIKAHILQGTSKDIEEISLVENIQRNDLTDFEVANFITTLWNSGQYNEKQDLAKAIGKTKSYVSKALGLVKLDDEIIEDLSTNNHDIGLSVLEEVSRVKDPVVQKEVFEKVKNKEITRSEIKDFKKPKEISPVKKEDKKATGDVPADTFIDDSREYVHIKDIGEVVDRLREAVERGCILKDSFLAFPSGEPSRYDDISISNCYEEAIFNILEEIERLKENQSKHKLIHSYEGVGDYACELDNMVKSLDFSLGAQMTSYIMADKSLIKIGKKYKITIEEM